MVDKVQLYEKKSDQATFTGIDDSQRDKTINLKLKDSKRNGYFGRFTAGGATDGYFDEELMANYFRQKEKLAVYGILSNTGKTGLNWQEGILRGKVSPATSTSTKIQSVKAIINT